jgi:hypothetical protein
VPDLIKLRFPDKSPPSRLLAESVGAPARRLNTTLYASILICLSNWLFSRQKVHAIACYMSRFFWIDD